jgi:D-3-phosphoglycerate dehydrogenase / 2-oxoglutarate reductase
MRILLADSNHPVLDQMLQANGFDCDKLWDLPASELKRILPDYDALVIRSKFKLSAELLTLCPKLKCIGRVGAGMENIDLDFAGKNNIACVSAPEGNRDAVGEHALGMLLMLLNNLKKADAEVRKNIWIRAENRGREISGKTVGIIGYGHMGQSFANKLKGFDCRILAFDKYRSVKAVGNDRVEECSLQEIFDECDIVSLHVPLNAETLFMVDQDFLSRFKKPIYLINTARGKCLKTESLVDGLELGSVLGACLDVLEYESTSFEQFDETEISEAFKYLLASDKVVLSPHIAGWTHESNYKMSKIIAEKMIAVLTPKN